MVFSFRIKTVKIRFYLQAEMCPVSGAPIPVANAREERPLPTWRPCPSHMLMTVSVSGIWVDRWWAALASMTRRPSWMQTSSLLSEGRMVQTSFLPSSGFLLPIRHDLCFGELLEPHRRTGPVKCMQNATNEGILSSKVLFPRVAYGIWSVTLKNDFLFFKCFHIFCLWKDCFHMFYLDKEFKWNYV